MTSTFVFCLILFQVVLVKSTTDYHWRDYAGVIPEDAIVGGHDNHDKPIYIGQSYIKDRGFVVIEINPGRTLYAHSYNARVVKDYIKILCGPRDHFYWFPTNHTQLMKHLYIEEKLLVFGGEEDIGENFVGRIKCDFGFCIGKILRTECFREKSGFYGVDRDGHELTADSFDVLVNIKKEPNGSESSLILTFPHSVGFVLCVLFSFIF
ncbi:uncharacterized protein LOC135123937 [Zophobas morio]|uniref:uncharacterized protein LOC135123937 n=1 Tax=Zophobas morio TaxID=2755281 RepID=UPI0030827C44